MSTLNAEATQYLNDILSNLNNSYITGTIDIESQQGKNWLGSVALATSVINDMQGNTPPLALGENDLVTFGNIQTMILGNLPDIIGMTREVRGDCVPESHSMKSEVMILENVQNVILKAFGGPSGAIGAGA
ncbi:hypothetical protein Clacol_005928 [Clathrus columnatus]|uniref:Uncharacterized protein n=1 Tax=Clathrus columnatus TaxID=1419009 RepID=A0AAV5ADB7_9AGAM|nr:hypothetical protein Clacol_005928 [Clathrus columnatus]